MTIRQMIEQDYREALALIPDIPSDLRRALRGHERVPAFFRNLEKEIANLKNLKLDLKREDIKTLVYDMTKFFCANAKRLADEMHLSDIRRLSEKASAQDFKDLDQTADGKPTGEFTELVKEVKDGEDKTLKNGTTEQTSQN